MGTLGRAIYVVGSWIRVAGQAVDRVGVGLQGTHLFQEQGKPSPIFDSKTPICSTFVFSDIAFYVFVEMPKRTRTIFRAEIDIMSCVYLIEF